MSYSLQIFIYHLISFFCVTVSRDRFVRICCQFKKAFVFKSYNKLRHLRSTRDWNLARVLWNFILYASSGGLEWCGLTGGLRDARICLMLFPGGAVSDRVAGTHQTALSSACKPTRPMLFLKGRWWASLSAALVVFWPTWLGNLPWLALPFPIPAFSSDFCAGGLRKTDGCVWWLLLLGRMWEKGCGEKRTRGALRVQRWEGATATAWQWVAASPKMVPNPWSGLCSCGDWILQAFF